MKEETKTSKKKFQGIVVSDAMAKTRIVEVTRLTKHKRYHKYYKVTKRFPAHDEAGEYKKGDEVVIEEVRPISKTKRWKVTGKVLKK